MIRTKHGGFSDEDALGDFRILVVDDDIDCIRLLSFLFNMEGFRITSASSADEALALLKRIPFSLMLTDYNMPGKDGLMLSEEALETTPELIIIMMTGNSSPQLSSRAAKSGVKAVLAKPINVNELLSMAHSVNKRRIMHRPQYDYGPVQDETGSLL